MSALERSEYPPPDPRESLLADSGQGARPLAYPRVDVPGQGPSPVTSAPRMVVAALLAVVLALLVGAQGVVHAGEGMSDGPMRVVVLAIGQRALQLSERLHFTAAWDRVESALGKQAQPDVAPLLVVHPSPGSSPTQRRRQHGFKLFPPEHAARSGTVGQAPVLHPVTARNPLRLLVTGDSLVGYLGPELISELSGIAPVHGVSDPHDGTGLTRPDFVDWSVVAGQQVAQQHPDAIVVMLGGNDFQNMTLPPNRFFAAGSAAWTREYQRRAEMVMRIWTQGGKNRVYWLAMPPARDPSWTKAYMQIDVALKNAARDVPGARYLDTLGPITRQGRYADFVPIDGQETLIRESDGVHLNIAGSRLLAHQVVPVVVRDWRLGAGACGVHSPSARQQCHALSRRRATTRRRPPQ